MRKGEKFMQGILAELHCHTQFFTWQLFSRRRLQNFLKRAQRRGLKLLAVTEHANIKSYWRVFEALEEINWRWKGLRVLPGTEITVREDGDLLVLGSPAGLRALKNAPGCWPAGDKRPRLDRLLDAAQDLDLMIIGAHPLRPGRNLAKLPHALLRKFDALEINALELEHIHDVSKLAATLGLPLVGGSDAHVSRQVGMVVNQVPAWVKGVKDLREAVRRRQTKVVIPGRDPLPG